MRAHLLLVDNPICDSIMFIQTLCLPWVVTLFQAVECISSLACASDTIKSGHSSRVIVHSFIRAHLLLVDNPICDSIMFIQTLCLLRVVTLCQAVECVSGLAGASDTLKAGHSSCIIRSYLHTLCGS